MNLDEALWVLGLHGARLRFRGDAAIIYIPLDRPEVQGTILTDMGYPNGRRIEDPIAPWEEKYYRAPLD
jgi:hypothetical protein